MMSLGHAMTKQCYEIQCEVEFSEEHNFKPDETVLRNTYCTVGLWQKCGIFITNCIIYVLFFFFFGDEAFVNRCI